MNTTSTAATSGDCRPTSRRRRGAPIALAATLALTVGICAAFLSAPGAPTASRPPSSTTVTMTSVQLDAWHRKTATPFDRAQVLAQMQAAFAGVAQVGVGPGPTTLTTLPQAAANSIEQVLALGITGDHFWVTASYADMARGAIYGAEIACENYGIPAPLCDAAGNMLVSWSRGWGSANNHGVWAAVYWWPPHVTGGRW